MSTTHSHPVSACICQTAQLAKPLNDSQLPMHEILRTFFVPSPAECIFVREKMSQIAAHMAQLDDEIDQVNKSLASLRDNHAALQRLSNEYRNVFNPTRRLPVEILGEIFIHLQEMLGGRSIVPTQVCRQWREIAIATHRLWRHIRARIGGRRSSQADVDLTPIWLQRSGSLPLTIEFGKCQDMEISAIDVMILNEAQRWNEIKLILMDATLPFLRSIPQHLPMLYSLEIDCIGTFNTSRIIIDNFKYATNLRVLTLGNRPSTHYPEIPWAQLTTCNLTSNRFYGSIDVYFVLSQAIHLRSCKVEICAHPLPPTLSTLCHACLISLEIILVVSGKLGDLFNVLKLPALSQLKLPGYYPDETLALMLSRSDCSLKQLSLGPNRYRFDLDRLHSIFSSTPLLTHLELHFDSAIVDLMDLLTRDPGHNAEAHCLLPQLTSIRLSEPEDFSHARFADLLASRFYGSHRGLEKIRTAVLMPSEYGLTVGGKRCCFLPEDTYLEYIALRDSGLDFHAYEPSLGMCTLEDYYVPERTYRRRM